MINNYGWTPLNSAAINGHVKVVRLLLEKGGDMTMANNKGWTPLNSAADSVHVEVVKLLLGGAPMFTRRADTRVMHSRQSRIEAMSKTPHDRQRSNWTISPQPL